MALIDSSDLRELLAFVHENAHLYDTLNVEFFSARVYERIDAKWLSFMCRLDSAQLNMLPIEFEQYPDCPATLKHFFASARRLSLLDKYSNRRRQFGYSSTTNNINKDHSTPADSTVQRSEQIAKQMRKVKRKKAHELAAFSELLLAECEPIGIDRVVDIGCGLGHLGRMLRLNNQSVDYVGIEANPALCHSALKNDVQMENIVFGMSNSSKQCRQILTLPGRRTAIVSLHGCGELQRQILLEFVAMCKQKHQQHSDNDDDVDHPQLLVTVGCCYHKLKDWTDSAIDRWMLSSQMRSLFLDIFCPHNLFPIAGLRLACQAKMVRWMAFTEQQHIAHRQAFVNRAFVECLRVHKAAKTTTPAAAISSIESNVCHNNVNDSDDLLRHHQRRPPRKLNKCMMANNNLCQFKAEVLRRSAVLEEQREQFEQKLDEIMDTHSPAIPFIEPFTALQFALQCPLESLVLLDRLLFLHENGISAELVQLFDPTISPRNIAIVARRTKNF